MVAGNIKNLFDHWDVATLRVSAPIEIIFVCGGTTDPKVPHDLSRRDALLSVCMIGDLSKYSFIRAEDVNVLAPRGHYRDFLTFELDIGQISQIVLLFCESSGSFVELGAFCMESEIAHRMLIVIDDKKHDDDSFIRWGPLHLLEELYSRSAICILKTEEVGQGVGSRPDDIDKDAFAVVIANALKARVRAARENQKFDKNKSGHMIKLITGLIQDYGALKADEILDILSRIGFPLNHDSLLRYLQCADALRWIKKDQRNLDDYFTATSEKEAIRFTFSGKPIDRHRWRADVLQYWKREDPNRFESIQVNRPIR